MITIATTELIFDLENAVKAGSPERRIHILRQVTGLFLSDADRLNEHHVGVFDEVLVRLMACVDTYTLAEISASFAGLRSAPKHAVRCLARHQDAAVAAPVLLNSGVLSDSDLVAIARENGQRHLLAIAGRKTQTPPLTDILLTRGDTGVCRELARNPGAQFSDSGFLALVDTAVRDDDGAASLIRRADITPDVIRHLVSKSTPAARARLLKNSPPEILGTIRSAIDSITIQAQEQTPEPIDYSEAKSIVLALSKSGKLNDSSVNRFAIRREHRNVIAALALLASVPTEAIEPLMKEKDCCGLAIACRASRLNWQTTAAIIANRNCGQPVSAKELAQVRDVFEMLSLSMAQRTIRFESVHEFAAMGTAPNSVPAGAS